MRGRVMALYAIVFLGSTAIGAPLIGLLAQVAGPRSGLVAGAAAALVAAAWARAEFGRTWARAPHRGPPGRDGAVNLAGGPVAPADSLSDRCR